MCIEVILWAVFPTVLGGCKLGYHVMLSGAVVNWSITLCCQLLKSFKISRECKWKSGLWFLIPGGGIGKGDGKKSWSPGMRWGCERKGSGKALGVGGGLRESELERKIVLPLLGKERQRAGPRVLRPALLMRKGMRVDVATAPTSCYLQPSLRKAYQTGSACSDSFDSKSN